MSDNNRKAKYYALTRAGRKQLAREEHEWLRTVEMMGRLLRPDGHAVNSSRA